MHRYSAEQAELAVMLKRIESDIQVLIASETHELLGIRSEERNKIVDEKHIMRVSIENAIEDVWRKFQKVTFTKRQAYCIRVVT